MKCFFTLPFILINLFCIAQTVTDIDGNVYPIITIGNQQWMGQNLRSTHFSDGSEIPNAGLSNFYGIPWETPRYAAPYIPVDFTTDPDALGLLYNYIAATDSRNVCPQGWHVPTDAEWAEMINFLDPTSTSNNTTTMESSIAGGMLKDTVLWISPNAGATNASGFSALPVGDIPATILPPEAYFCCSGMNTSYWCGGAPWTPATICYYRYLGTFDVGSFRDSDDYKNGKSVRCISDSEGTSTGEERVKTPIRLYPNPANDRITVELSSGITAIKLYNSVGQCLGSHTVLGKTLEIELSHYPSGFYMVVPDGGTTAVQFMKY